MVQLTVLLSLLVVFSMLYKWSSTTSIVTDTTTPVLPAASTPTPWPPSAITSDSILEPITSHRPLPPQTPEDQALSLACVLTEKLAKLDQKDANLVSLYDSCLPFLASHYGLAKNIPQDQLVMACSAAITEYSKQLRSVCERKDKRDNNTQQDGDASADRDGDASIKNRDESEQSERYQDESPLCLSSEGQGRRKRHDLIIQVSGFLTKPAHRNLYDRIFQSVIEKTRARHGLDIWDGSASRVGDAAGGSPFFPFSSRDESNKGDSGGRPLSGWWRWGGDAEDQGHCHGDTPGQSGFEPEVDNVVLESICAPFWNQGLVNVGWLIDF